MNLFQEVFHDTELFFSNSQLKWLSCYIQGCQGTAADNDVSLYYSTANSEI